ncbi:hypothetical protein E1162_02195 [Rhodobacteraceae bacterium RKSG542]|nr:hypothetical protein [Pseudovibrio flavus]
MDAFLSLFQDMPRWWGIVFLITFAITGRLFRDNWRQQNEGWQNRCWVFGSAAVISFALMVFGSFDFTS